MAVPAIISSAGAWSVDGGRGAAGFAVAPASGGIAASSGAPGLRRGSRGVSTFEASVSADVGLEGSTSLRRGSRGASGAIRIHLGAGPAAASAVPCAVDPSAMPLWPAGCGTPVWPSPCSATSAGPAAFGKAPGSDGSFEEAGRSAAVPSSSAGCMGSDPGLGGSPGGTHAPGVGAVAFHTDPAPSRRGCGPSQLSGGRPAPPQALSIVLEFAPSGLTTACGFQEVGGHPGIQQGAPPTPHGPAALALLLLLPPPQQPSSFRAGTMSCGPPTSL